MAFRFRLDTVLRHRSRLVEERSREVAAAGARLNKLNLQVQVMERELEKAFDEEKLHDGTPLHLGDMMAKRRWLEYLGIEKDRITLIRVGAQATLDESRQHLEEAWRQHEVLDRLRRQRKGEYQARERRIETLVMDEIASVRHTIARSAEYAGLGAGLAGPRMTRTSGSR